LRSGGLIDPDKAAELLEARDPALFSERLLEAAHSTAGVEELFAFRVDEGAPPLALAGAHAVLTGREREVCARTLAGRTAREIGAELGLAVGTVLTYRQRACQKLRVSRSSELLAAVMG
jgi:DNA-binding CsgD family transcriptional regulator